MIKQRLLVIPRLTLAAVAVLAISAPPRAGRAFEPADHPCFKTAPTWNATNGALVSGISKGPVAAIFTALNQSRTHVMMAHVTPGGYWATESTTLQPSIHKTTVKVCVLGVCVKAGQIPEPSMPLEPKELAAGAPGFSQINMGGAYAYWIDATQVFRQVSPRPSASPICKYNCQINGVADWLWQNVPYDQVTSAADSSTWYYSLKSTDPSGTTAHISYGVHQFMDGFMRATVGMTGESPSNRGLACSQVPAWGYRNWVLQTDEDLGTFSREISTHKYSHAQTVEAGQALWSSVYGGCMDQDAGFWGGLVNAYTGLMGQSLQDQTCRSAAYQVLNCFFQGENSNGSGCTSSSATPWNNYKAGTAAGANSLSPDDIMGLSGSANAGPWSTSTQEMLQWNGGGSTYGCFY